MRGVGGHQWLNCGSRTLPRSAAHDYHYGRVRTEDAQFFGPGKATMDDGGDDTTSGDHSGRSGPIGTGFRVADCRRCDRDVLTARQLDGDTLRDVCLHCEHPVDTDRLRQVSTQRVVEMGYIIDGDDDDCGTQRGCRGKDCGVHQPDAL